MMERSRTGAERSVAAERVRAALARTSNPAERLLLLGDVHRHSDAYHLALMNPEMPFRTCLAEILSRSLDVAAEPNQPFLEYAGAFPMFIALRGAAEGSGTD